MPPSLMNVFVKSFFFLLSIQVTKKVHLPFPLKLDTVSHPVNAWKYGNALQTSIVKCSINDKVLYHVGFGVTSLSGWTWNFKHCIIHSWWKGNSSYRGLHITKGAYYQHHRMDTIFEAKYSPKSCLLSVLQLENCVEREQRQLSVTPVYLTNLVLF